jgi:hypothetical protein
MITLQPPYDFHAGINEYVQHLEKVAHAFNEHARAEHLGVRLDASSAIAAVSDLRTSLNKIAPYLTRPDDTGVLHPEQLVTSIDAMIQVLGKPDEAGLILGALQSGKTTTGLALQLLGPIYYRLTGKMLYPFYLLTSQTSHQAQTTHELTRFLQYYGDLKFEIDATHPNPTYQTPESALHPLFVIAPTLSMYRDHVLNHVKDYFSLPKVEDYVWRRAWGENVQRIADRVEALAKAGFIPFMIIDEPQFGASDRIEIDPSGAVHRHPCVFARIFDETAKRLNIARDKHVFIALSATPYEIHDLKRIWKVPQRLGQGYSGFNFFAGALIDESIEINPPRILSFTEFAQEVGVPFLARTNLQAFDSLQRFNKMSSKLAYPNEWQDYRDDVLLAISQTLLNLRERHQGEVFGVCMRTINNNVKASDILEALPIGDEFDIVEYYGMEATGKSVKQILAERDEARRRKPFVLMVTSRARMGDAFPAEVKYFFEFTEKFTDLNSMMQGLIGRACGYGKSSTVVLSTRNTIMVRAVSSVQGGYLMDPSRHSMVVGGKRRGRPTVILTVRRQPEDERLDEFFRRIDGELVNALVEQPTASLRTRRKDTRRTGPVLRIAEETGLFEYLESDVAHERYYENYQRFRLARIGDKVQNLSRLGSFLEYRVDKEGDCRFAFREWKGEGHTGLRARGRSGGDDDDVTRREHDHLEPQILLEKYDTTTGVPTADYGDQPRAAGMWRSCAVVLPLLHPVQEFVVGDAAYPIETSPFSEWMDADELTARRLERERRQAGD